LDNIASQNSNDWAWDVKIDLNGNIVLTGLSQSQDYTTTEMFTARLHNDGTKDNTFSGGLIGGNAEFGQNRTLRLKSQ